jgi:hypothetical protein
MIGRCVMERGAVEVNRDPETIETMEASPDSYTPALQ